MIRFYPLSEGTGAQPSAGSLQKQKWFQVTHVSSLSSNRHARSGRGIQIVREHPLSLPTTRFSRLQLTASEAFRTRSERNRLSGNGLSLTCSGFRLTTI